MTFVTFQHNQPAFYMHAGHQPDIMRLRYRRYPGFIRWLIAFLMEPVTEVTVEFDEDQLPCAECLRALKRELLDYYTQDDGVYAEFQPAGTGFLRLHVYDEDRLVIGEEFDELADIVEEYLAGCQSGCHSQTTSA